MVSFSSGYAPQLLPLRTGQAPRAAEVGNALAIPTTQEVAALTPPKKEGRPPITPKEMASSAAIWTAVFLAGSTLWDAHQIKAFFPKETFTQRLKTLFTNAELKKVTWRNMAINAVFGVVLSVGVDLAMNLFNTNSKK